MRTAIVNGSVMNTTEIMQWVADNRAYTLDRHTLLWRMRKGLTGEALIAKAVHGGSKPKPRTDKQLANDARYRAKKRAERDMWKNFYAWPRPKDLVHGG